MSTRMEGDKKGEEEKLCMFYRATIPEKTLLRELAHDRTIALDKLAKSDYVKSKQAIKKVKTDYLNKETDATKNCRLQEGTILKLKDYNQEINLCRFSDFSGIEAEAFLRGRKVPGNKRILELRNPKKKKHY